MQKRYTIQSDLASLGRTLWNNLVVGHHTDTLDQREGYKRTTPKGEEEKGSANLIIVKGEQKSQ